MRPSILAMMLCAGCSGDNQPAGDPAGSDPPLGPTTAFSLTGTVTNSVSPIQQGRLIVGLASSQALPQRILCDKLVRRWDESGVTLPATYKLEQLPEGTLVLVALLVDASGESMMPGAAYMVTVDKAGVHFEGRITSSIPVNIQGTVGYDCN